MKVAMVGHKVIPSRRGGIENVLTSLCPLLVEKGATITCYNRSSDKIENEYVDMVVDKLRIGSAHDQQLDSLVSKRQQLCFGSYRPRLACQPPPRAPPYAV